MSKDVTVVVPTWNAGRELEGILQEMLAQKLASPFELLAIDSGSTDGTLEVLRRLPVRLLEIPQREFDHGLTRALGVREARGEIVVFATQDARPYDRQWLRRLCECFADPEVAGAYSRQLPRPDADLFIRDRLGAWSAAGEEPRVQKLGDDEDFAALAPLDKLARIAFDDVSSAVRRRVALRIPYREKSFGEDLDWSLRVIQAGYKIVFEPRSKVIHSHNRSVAYEFRRVCLDHAHLHALLGVHTVPTWRHVARSSVAEVRRLWGVVAAEKDLDRRRRLYWRARAVAFGSTQVLAQYVGAALADRPGRGGRAIRGAVRRWIGRGI